MSFILALAMIVGLIPIGIGSNVDANTKAAGELIQIPNKEENTLAGIFDYYYRQTGDSNSNPDIYQTGAIDTSAGGISGDGSDIVRIAKRTTYIGGLVSKHTYNILENDFEYSGDVSMIGGDDPGIRGMAFAFHNDPRGNHALGGEQGNLGIHGMNYWGRVYSPLANSIAIELDADTNGSGARNNSKPDTNFDKSGSGSHIAIVRPVADGGTVEHKATSWIPGSLMTGKSENTTLGYDPNRPPSSQTIRVRWTNEGDHYRLSYEYWFHGDSKDIPGATIYTG